MEDNNKKLLFVISVIALVVMIIQLNDAFGSNLEENDNSLVANNNNADDNLEMDEEKNKINAMNININNRITVGSDLTIYEEEPISLKPIISNTIALPANSLIFLESN